MEHTESFANQRHRSSCASRKACYGLSYSTAGGIGTDRPSLVDTASVRGYGDGGGESTTGRYRMQSPS